MAVFRQFPQVSLGELNATTEWDVSDADEIVIGHNFAGVTATVTFYASVDGLTFYITSMDGMNGSNRNSQGTTRANSSGPSRKNISGLKVIREVMTAWTSGTAIVEAKTGRF